jgi:hypothetical protein
VESERSRHERGQVAGQGQLLFLAFLVWSLSVLSQKLVKLSLGICYGVHGEFWGIGLVYVVGVHFLLVLYIYYVTLLFSLLYLFDLPLCYSSLL